MQKKRGKMFKVRRNSRLKEKNGEGKLKNVKEKNTIEEERNTAGPKTVGKSVVLVFTQSDLTQTNFLIRFSLQPNGVDF